MLQPSQEGEALSSSEGTPLSPSSRSPVVGELAQFTGPPVPELSIESATALNFELLDDLRDVGDTLRESIQRFLDDHLRCSNGCVVSTPQAGFLSSNRNDPSVQSVRDSLEQAIDVCSLIAGQRDEVNDYMVNLRKVASHFQANAQAVLIEMRAMNVGHTVPDAHLPDVMRRMNEMQGVVREVDLNLDILVENLLDQAPSQ
jgi:hypothetical protein